jgi:hypothetical protein
MDVQEEMSGKTGRHHWNKGMELKEAEEDETQVSSPVTHMM